jgi:hypothetical protein
MICFYEARFSFCKDGVSEERISGDRALNALSYSTLGDFGTFDILIVGLILFGSPALSLFILVEISGHEVLRWVQKMCVKMVHQLTVGHFPEKKKTYGRPCLWCRLFRNVPCSLALLHTKNKKRN